MYHIELSHLYQTNNVNKINFATVQFVRLLHIFVVCDVFIHDSISILTHKEEVEFLTTTSPFFRSYPFQMLAKSQNRFLVDLESSF